LELDNEQWWLLRRELIDGRTLFLIRQIFNYKITVGYGELTWDESY
jgi:hypothetical protein